MFHFNEFFPKLYEPLKSSTLYRYRILPELFIILLLPVASAVCLIFPKALERRFSPRSRPLQEPIFTVGAWYIIGYLLLAASIFLLAMFKR
jgi:hypothetical protein